ncbi:protein FAM151B isoform X1 [Bombus vancouverensis nearcticus]|uniref:Protein FAM151B isoform X1 n=2 Tax=Bombus bifarius TaxID=103933 RepID=A0A6P8MGR8_9HYME|nr:protein FAM151B isoform X1 [Bombus vancouverensis nearcticus]XP_033313011.1 protein FAM151B isoform X1 [Bombus bifarius]
MKSITTTATSLLFLALIQAAMSASNVSVDVATFFPDIEGNLTKIVWEHAVNSKEKLDNALVSANVKMLEADVTLGTLNGTSDNSTQLIPIMAHPPATKSNLSLDDFLNTVIKKNVTKGIKLDFKSINAFNASIPILEKVRNNTKFPVFLNADILPGPVNASTTPVTAKAFVSQAMAFPEYTLSVGWTTRYGVNDNVTEGQYTEQQIQDMINILKEQKVTQPITYPVRAGLAANSTKVIKSLMENSSFASNVTLTVWSSEGDKVDAETLSTLIRDIGVKKVYVDVPQDLMNKLHLSGASSVMVASVTLAVSLLTGLLSSIL